MKRRPGLRIPAPGTRSSARCARCWASRSASPRGARWPRAWSPAPAAPIAGGTDGLTHLFPSPAALAAADLDGLGLTGARVAALQALARAVAERRARFRRAGGGSHAALAALPGFGAWTAQYVALRALGEPDAFPAADLVLRRMAAGGGPPLTARALEARAEAWRPWRGYAVLHLWRKASEPAGT